MKQKQVQSWVKHLDFILFDLIALEAAFVIAFMLRFGIANPFGQSEWRSYGLIILLFDAIIMVLGNHLSGILRRGYLRELLAIIWQGIILVGIITLYFYVIHEGISYSRLVVGFNAAIYIVLNFIIRTIWKKIIGNKISHNARCFVLIGEGDMAARFENALTQTPNLGVLLHKVTAEAELEELLATDEIFEVVTALPATQAGRVAGIVHLCEKYGVRANVIPSYADIMSSQASIEEIGDVKLLNFRTTPLDNMTNAMIKRAFDIISSAILIVLTSPIMLVAAIGTKLSGVGSIIFRQIRVGRNKINFGMLKFRSMRDIGTEDTGWTTDNDPRKTKFGAILRKYSIDEFPQFFNVFAGQMSLIGPRPELPHHVEHFANEIPMYQVRHQVRPGITGWAQVNGLRGDTDISERVKYDVWYIENWSIALDIKIIFRTIFGGMINKEKL